MSVNVSFTLGNLPANYCFSTLQAYANDIIALLTGTISGGFAGVIIGANTPAVGDQGKAWIKTDSSGNPIGLFLYQGAWLRPNPTPPGGVTGERRIWTGIENPDLWLYDGGDGTNPGGGVTATTGAMWMIDTAFAFKVPIGAGTNPVAYGGVNTTIAVNGTAGEEKHVMAALEDALHSHVMGNWDQTGGVNTHMAFVAPGTSPAIASTPSMNIGTTIQGGPPTLTQGNLVTSLAVAEANATNAHNTLPPVLGVSFIRRTGRIYYVG